VITFAVVGRNEAPYLPTSLGQAIEAADDGDRVVFVDSASSDDSAKVAAGMGVEVLPAPEGKGRAVATALDHCEGGGLCLLDADIEFSDTNIAAALAHRYRQGGADMVVAEFEWLGKGRLMTVDAVFLPIVRALFPDATAVSDWTALNGFRVFDAALPLGRLPAGFGIESHLSVALAIDGRRIETVHVGRDRGPLRDKRAMGPAVSEALFDLAEERGRLDPACRQQWERWVAEIALIIARRPDSEAELYENDQRALEAILARPRPPAQPSAAASSGGEPPSRTSGE
jgi:glucosyl-3-phosphoglycerate synthase